MEAGRRKEENRQAKEEFWQRTRQIDREEDEEAREMDEYYLRLQYMYESCQGCDRKIRKLVEEQQELLDILRMRKREFSDDWRRRLVRD